MLAASRWLFARLAGSTSQVNRCGFRKPDAQISFRAPGQRGERVVARNAIAAILADRARRRVQRRDRERCAGSFRPAYRGAAGSAASPCAARRRRRRRTRCTSTRQSASPGRAVGLKIRSPIGWMRVFNCTRINSRAEPSKVAFDTFESVHSITMASRSMVPGVVIGGRRRVSGDVQAGHARRVGQQRARRRRLLEVDGVELPVPPIVGIELKADEPVGVAGLERKLVEEAGPVAAAVEVQIRRERLGLLVEDVQRAVQVVDEESPRAARLLPQHVDAGERPEVAGAGRRSGHRRGRVVLDVQDERRLGAHASCQKRHGEQTSVRPYRIMASARTRARRRSCSTAGRSAAGRPETRDRDGRRTSRNGLPSASSRRWCRSSSRRLARAAQRSSASRCRSRTSCRTKTAAGRSRRSGRCRPVFHD